MKCIADAPHPWTYGGVVHLVRHYVPVAEQLASMVYCSPLCTLPTTKLNLYVCRPDAIGQAITCIVCAARV